MMMMMMIDNDNDKGECLLWWWWLIKSIIDMTLLPFQQIYRSVFFPSYDHDVDVDDHMLIVLFFFCFFFVLFCLWQCLQTNTHTHTQSILDSGKKNIGKQFHNLRSTIIIIINFVPFFAWYKYKKKISKHHHRHHHLINLTIFWYYYLNLWVHVLFFV